MITRLATHNDIPAVLNLQEQNLYENLSDEEKRSGFVTTPFTIEQLERLIQLRGLFISESETDITGYAMAAGWDYFSQWQIFPYMISRLSGSTFNGITVSAQNSFQYGPVCIAAVQRGSNTLPRLFEEIRIEMATRYPIGITFINKINSRSYQAHTRKIGITVIDEFEFSGRNYYALAFDTKRSVLQQANQ